jgi:hypothetical protein
MPLEVKTIDGVKWVRLSEHQEEVQETKRQLEEAKTRLKHYAENYIHKDAKRTSAQPQSNGFPDLFGNFF